MANVHDVAAFILRECGPMSWQKLHCLLYYAQAWHIAWSGKPLFDADIYAYNPATDGTIEEFMEQLDKELGSAAPGRGR